MEPSVCADHEFIPVSEFARRVHRSPVTIWGRIRNRRMPEGTVFDVMGHIEIDWTAWVAIVRSRKIV
jgi:hypothetical protein